jgi:thiol-disulfide isomerase/thioredoxin
MLLKDIPYLRRKNFTNDGVLNINKFKDKIVVIFIHANYCQYCHNAAPEYNNASLIAPPGVVFTALQIDGDSPGEKEAKEILSKIVKNYIGVPEYAFFKNNKPVFKELNSRNSNSIIHKVLEIQNEY